jgi:hypothetical protein
MFRRRHDRRLLARFATWALLPSAGLSTSCTARVLQDAAAPPACGSDDDCAAGFVCVDEACAGRDADPTPRESTIVGPDGGVVIGPDGIVLTVDAGALDGTTAFTITTSTSTLDYANFTPTTRLYAIEPATAFAGATASLHVPTAADSDNGARTTLFLQPTPPGPTWEPVLDGDGDGSFALSRTGTFGIGIAVEAAP